MNTIETINILKKVEDIIETFNNKVRFHNNNHEEIGIDYLTDLNGNTLEQLHDILSSQVEDICNYIEVYKYNINSALRLIKSIPDYETTILNF